MKQQTFSLIFGFILISIHLFSQKPIDLGLSVKWSSCNIGAFSSEQLGNRFAWGETESKQTFNADNYEYYNKEKFDELLDAGKTLELIHGAAYEYIGENISNTRFDAASLSYGNNWRMPTYDDWKELQSRCKWDWINLNGNVGYKVTGPNGNSIFLPAECGSYNCSASYWTATADCENGFYNSAYFFYITNGSYSPGHSMRYMGFFIRPVYKL